MRNGSQKISFLVLCAVFVSTLASHPGTTAKESDDSQVTLLSSSDMAERLPIRRNLNDPIVCSDLSKKKCKKETDKCIFYKDKKYIYVCEVKKSKFEVNCILYTESKCKKYCEWHGNMCVHKCDTDIKSECKKAEYKEGKTMCKYKKIKDPIYKTCIDKPTETTSPTIASTPSPSLNPVSNPSPRPVSNPTTSPTATPVECKDGGTYYFKAERGDRELFETCLDLKGKEPTQQGRICDTDASGVKDGVTYGPAKVVCKVTCGTCGGNPSSPTLTPVSNPNPRPVSNPTTSPTVTPVECKDGGTYYFKSERADRELFESCLDLKGKGLTQQGRICDTDASGVKDGVTYGPAKVVCKVTCGTCGGNPSAPTPPTPSTPQPTPSSSDGYSKWRLWTQEEYLLTYGKWQMLEMEFYDDSSCSGTQFNDGRPIDSGHPSDTTGPDKAFDGNEGTKWGGRPENEITREYWIGMEFEDPVKVLCVSFIDDSNKNRGTSFVKVQVYDGDSDTWIDLVDREHNAGERQDIAIPGGPGTSAPTPASAPTSIGDEVYIKNLTGDISYKKMRNRNPDCTDYVGSYFANIKNGQQELKMDFEITADTKECTLTSNNIPNHDVGGSVLPNKDDYVLILPRNPSNPVASAKAVYVQKQGGKLTLNGILLNGVDLDMDSAFCYNPIFTTPNNISLGTGSDKCGIKDYHWYAIPAANPENVKLDEFSGHPYKGRYHYHGDNEALSFLKAADITTEYGSPVVGWAPDGFPLYGHYFYDKDNNEVRKVKSGWQIKVAFKNGREKPSGATFDPPPINTHKLGIFVEDWEYVANSGDLDECNGMTDAFGNYAYYWTETYPYGPRCTFGAPHVSFTKEGCEYNSGNSGCNKFSFVVSNSNAEHGHEHGISGTAVTGGAAQAISSVSVVAIAATGVAVIGVL